MCMLKINQMIEKITQLLLAPTKHYSLQIKTSKPIMNAKMFKQKKKVIRLS